MGSLCGACAVLALLISRKRHLFWKLLCLAGLGQGSEFGQQILRFNGFGQQLPGHTSGRGVAHQFVGGGLAGKKEDVAVGEPCMNLLTDFYTVGTRHDYIRNNHRRAHGLGFLQGPSRQRRLP